MKKNNPIKSILSRRNLLLLIFHGEKWRNLFCYEFSAPCLSWRLEVSNLGTQTELFKQRREKKRNLSCSSMAVALLLISQFQTPSLHGYLDFATQDTNCFAFSVASELVEDKNFETFCAPGWAGGKSWTQQDTLVQIRYEGLNLKALAVIYFLKSHLWFHTINILMIGVGGVQYVSKEVQILFEEDALISQNFWTHFQLKETFNSVNDRPDCLWQTHLTIL